MSILNLYLPFFSERRGGRGYLTKCVYGLFVICEFFFLLSWDFKTTAERTGKCYLSYSVLFFVFFVFFHLCHHQRDRPSFLLCKLPFPFLPLHIKEVFFFLLLWSRHVFVLSLKNLFVYVFAIKKENAIKKKNKKQKWLFSGFEHSVMQRHMWPLKHLPADPCCFPTTRVGERVKGLSAKKQDQCLFSQKPCFFLPLLFIFFLPLSPRQLVAAGGRGSGGPGGGI